MKTKSIHVSNLGSFGVNLSNANGYVTCHDSLRYAKATNAKLDTWSESRVKAVRNAAAVEMAKREIRQWRKAN